MNGLLARLARGPGSSCAHRVGPVAGRRAGAVLLGLLVVAPWSHGAIAANRALVVGNGAYPFAPLENPINDARAVAGVLSEVGFDVALVEDADLAGFAAGLDRLKGNLARGDTALFYYAGHDVQYRGINYLLPTDIELESPEQLPETAVSVNQIMTEIHRTGAGVNIVILDSCRNTTRSARSATRSATASPMSSAAPARR